MKHSRRLITPAVTALALAVPAAGVTSSAQAVTLPASSQLASGLQTLLSPSAATSITNDVIRIASSPTAANIGTLDQALNAVLTGVSSLVLPTKTASAGASLETTLTALGSLLPASPTAAQQQAVNELGTAVTDAGLSSLLSGLGSSASTAAAELTSLQSLEAGESTDNTSTAAIGAVVSALAGDAGPASPAGASLSSVAATLSSGDFLTPAQLQSIISALASVSSTNAAGTSGATVTQVAAALATVISQSGSLAGALANAGSSLSPITDPSDLSTALSEIGSLAGSAPGTELQLPGLAEIFNAIAATPGVSTEAASELESVAASISSGVTPTALLGDVADLTEAPLPSSLQNLSNQIAGDLSGSGAVLGTIPGLTSSVQTEALDELASLGQGSGTGTLPGLADVLAAVRTSDPEVGPALTDLEAILQTDSLDSAQLAGAAGVVSYAAQTQAGTEAATLSALAQELSHDASTMTQAPAVTVSTTPPSLTSVPIVSSVALLRASRAGNDVAVTLSCPSGGGSCTATLVSTEAWAKKVTRHVTVAAGGRATVVIAMKPKPPRRIIRPTIRLVITSASHQIIRALG